MRIVIVKGTTWVTLGIALALCVLIAAVLGILVFKGLAALLEWAWNL